MFLNTVVFDLGDPKLGSSGWQMYWPFWAILFLPVVVVSQLSLPKQHVLLHGFAMAVILVMIELSFYFNLGWPIVIVELAAISIILILLGRIYYKGRAGVGTDPD